MQPPSASPVESKAFLKSKTIIGGLIVIVPVVLNMAGVEVADKDVQDTGVDLLAIIGAALAIYGRFFARKTLTLGSVPKDSTLVLLAFAAATALILTACAQGRGTRLVESIEGNATVQRDPLTGAATGTVGGRIYFRDGRDAKTIRPLSLRPPAVEAIAPIVITNGQPKEAR